MKRGLFTFALAALTIGLLGSCSKINERIDGLDNRVYDLENENIASVEQQFATINQSIADLSTIRTNIQTLMDAKTAMGEDITKLKAADQTLEGKINDLKTYVDTELAKYATKDWVNATFATLAKQAEIITDVEKLKTDLAGLDTKLDKAIANLDSSLRGWVNGQLSGYYTIAQVDAKVDGIQSDIDALKTDNETNKSDIEKLEADLAKLTQDLATAKADIETAYKKAIKDAIEGNDGYITETIKTAIATANGKIDDLTERVGTLESDVATLKNDVDALKAMIQTVSIIPAYSNGSLKAEDGILTINCVITPKKAVESLTKENFTILTSESEVLTKSALYGTLTIAKDEDLVLDKTNGTATIKVDVSSVLPAEEDKALTVAVNISSGISDFTTEFVPVYEPSYVEIKMTVGGQEKTYKWAKCNIGATKETDYGDYYAWGTTVKAYSAVDYSKTTDAFTFVSSNPYGDIYKNSWDASKGFNWVNTPFTSGVYARDINQKVFTKYVPKNMKATYGDGGNFYDDKIVLDPDDDVAHKVLGGNWRMPTEAEFKALCSLTKEWKTDYKGSGVNGYLFTDADGNSIFLPAAGQGAAEGSDDGTVLSGVGDYGYYWSSSLYTYAPCYANNLRFSKFSSPSMDFTHRFYGRSVRAISE